MIDVHSIIEITALKSQLHQATLQLQKILFSRNQYLVAERFGLRCKLNNKGRPQCEEPYRTKVTIVFSLQKATFHC
jgi:hypothetical protein